VLRAQDGQVLRGIGLFHAQAVDEGACGHFPVAQEFNDGYPRGVRQSLEEFRLKPSEGILHICIFELSNIL
jgi:hypothetical protein